MKWLNGLYEQQTNVRFFLLFVKVLMETFQEAWNAYDEEIVFKVSEWHHITQTVSDHQMVKVIAAKGGILVVYCYTVLSKHMKMLSISPHIVPRVMTWEWCSSHRTISCVRSAIG